MERRSKVVDYAFAVFDDFFGDLMEAREEAGRRLGDEVTRLWAGVLVDLGAILIDESRLILERLERGKDLVEDIQREAREQRASGDSSQPIPYRVT